MTSQDSNKVTIQEAGKALDNLRKLGGWLKLIIKRVISLIVIFALTFSLSACGLIKFLGNIEIPEPPTGYEPKPTVTPTPLPELTSTPTVTPSPVVTQTPFPTPTPKPSVSSPLMTRFKIGGFGQDCKPGNICCHNPESGPQFQNRHICEVGSTQLFNYEDRDKWSLNHGGPCDEDHQTTWKNVCHERDWDIEGGPGIEVRGAISWEKADNPHHTLVQFVPGTCFEICAYAPVNAKTADGLEVLVADNNKTCSTHCY